MEAPYEYDDTASASPDAESADAYAANPFGNAGGGLTHPWMGDGADMSPPALINQQYATRRPPRV